MPIEETASSAGVSLGQRLRAARLARSMTQSDVADGQFSISYVSAVERGQLRPSLRALEKLSRRLHIQITDLLREDTTGGTPSASSRTSFETNGHRDEWEQRLWGAQILARQGKTAEALDMVSHLRSHLPTLAPDERARWHWQLACMYLTLGRADEAQSELHRGIALVEQTGNIALYEWLRYGLGKVHQLKRQWPQALEIYQECLVTSGHRAQFDPTMRLKLLAGLGEVYWQLDEYELSGDYLCQATQAAQELLDTERLAAQYWVASSTYSSQGDPHRALEYAVRSATAYDERDLQRQTLRTYCRLGRVNLQAQRLDMALAHLETARAMAERWHDLAGHVEALCGIAAIYLDQTRLDDAAAAVELARDEANTLDDQVLHAEVFLVGARLLEAQGEMEAARGDFQQAIALLEKDVEPQRLSLAYKEYSDFVERLGDSTQALGLLKKAWRVRDSALAGV